MEAGKNSVIYMGLISGPNKADDTCGRTTVTGTMDRGFTVYVYIYIKVCLLFLVPTCLHFSIVHITEYKIKYRALNDAKKNKKGNVHINVKFRHICVTIVAMEKQSVLNIMSVCLYS